MKKVHLNLSVDKDLVNKARDEGIVISRFLEKKLGEHFSFMGLVSKVNKNGMGSPRFELGFLAPKAKRMDQATPRALCFPGNII